MAGPAGESEAAEVLSGRARVRRAHAGSPAARAAQIEARILALEVQLDRLPLLGGYRPHHGQTYHVPPCPFDGNFNATITAQLTFSRSGAGILAIVPILGMIVPEMGTIARPLPASGLADVLFTPVQQRVLGLLYGQPDRTFQSAELIRLAGSGTGAVHRLLTRLESSQLVLTERVGNQKHYRANRDSPIYRELHGLITKTSGLVTPIQAALSPLAGKIHGAFIYGSIAKGTDRASSDIDVLVVADKIDYSDVYSALEEVEAQLARKINPNVMSLADWRKKRAGSGFAARIASQPRMFVIGSENDIE